MYKIKGTSRPNFKLGESFIPVYQETIYPPYHPLLNLKLHNDDDEINPLMGRCDYKKRLRHAFIHGKEVIQCVHHTSENAGVLERYGTAGGHIALVAMI